jgi:hypothetical protein
MRNVLNLTVAAALTLSVGVVQAGEAKYDAPVNIDLVFIYHIDADIPEQDVFVVRELGSNEMWRATKGDQDLSQPIYASYDPVPHDPFNPEAVGPYPKGPELSLKLGEWFGATGAGTYSCIDGTATIDVSFTGLVPDGVYTMWHWFNADPPTEPFKEGFDIPVGSRDGTDSVFTADTEGSARFTRSMKPDSLAQRWPSIWCSCRGSREERARAALPGPAEAGRELTNTYVSGSTDWRRCFDAQSIDRRLFRQSARHSQRRPH